MSVLVFFSLPTELQKYSSTGKGLTNSVFGKWKASTDSSKQLWDTVGHFIIHTVGSEPRTHRGGGKIAVRTLLKASTVGV